MHVGHACHCRSRSNDVVDLEAQAGPAPLASPRIKAHHGESTARQQFQHQPPSLFMTLLVVAVWCVCWFQCKCSIYVLHGPMHGMLFSLVAVESCSVVS